MELLSLSFFHVFSQHSTYRFSSKQKAIYSEIISKIDIKGHRLNFTF